MDDVLAAAILADQSGVVDCSCCGELQMDESFYDPFSVLWKLALLPASEGMDHLILSYQHFLHLMCVVSQSGLILEFLAVI